jgi:tellurium resistance protein TerD
MKRGSNVELTREVPGLTSIVLGVRVSAGAEKPLADNLVVATILCDAASRALSDEHFVFFNQLSSPEMSVTQLEAALSGDDEQIEVDLTAVPADVHHIVVVLYINEGMVTRRVLGQLKDCRLRVLNLASNTELVRSENLAAVLLAETAATLGEVYRHDGGWKFKVIGEGYANGVAGIADDYGLTL